MTSCLALALVPFAASAETALVYVTNSAGDSVDVINPLTNKVVQNISIVGSHGVNFSPDGSRVYISNEATSTLDVFEQKTGKLLKKITLSNHPNNIAVVTKDGRIVVAIARGQGALDVIDPVKLEVEKTIPTHGRLHNCYTSKDSNYAMCGSVQTGVFTAFDMKTETIAWEHKFDHGVRPMTIDFGGVKGRIVLPHGTTMTGQRALRASQLGTEPIRWCQKCRGAPITSASALNSAAIAASSRAGLPRRVRTCTSSSLASAAWSSSVSSQRSSESASRRRPTTWPVSGSQYTPGEVT